MLRASTKTLFAMTACCASVALGAAPSFAQSPENDAAKRLDQKLESPQVTDGCTPEQHQQYDVKGFKIECGALMTGGTTLGSMQLAYTVATIEECAAHCRKSKRCVAFSYQWQTQPNRHSCYLFGPTPFANKAKQWISAVR